MKYVYIGLIMLLLVPMVLAGTEICKVPGEISFEMKNDKLIIFELSDNENFEKREFKIEMVKLNSSDYILELYGYDDFVFKIINLSEGNYVSNLKFAGSIEVTNSSIVLEELETCRRFITNVTECYIKTNVYRDKYDSLFEDATKMVNKTLFDEIETNLTTKYDNLEREYETYKSNKDTEIKENQERIGDLETHRQWGIIGAISGIGIAIYLLNKYTGLGRRKHGEQTEFPKDVAS